MTSPLTVVWRHRRENLKKCSLRGLEGRDDMLFFRYPDQPLPPLNGYILLDIDAPPLSIDDANAGIFLIDATWRYAEVMGRQVDDKSMLRRSLPNQYRTAYPRRQDDCTDPTRGLASVEALAIAYSITGRSWEPLLDNYHWKERFIELNALDPSCHRNLATGAR